MVFRTDASYSRWLEALEVWNRVRSKSREYVSNSMGWYKDAALQKMAIRW
jgi:hypothetical protein